MRYLAIIISVLSLLYNGYSFFNTLFFFHLTRLNNINRSPLIIAMIFEVIFIFISYTILASLIIDLRRNLLTPKWKIISGILSLPVSIGILILTAMVATYLYKNSP